MYLVSLGDVDWDVSQAIYHTLARLGIESLIICSPKQKYVSVGYFQDTEKEVDLDYLEKAGLPLIRREVGGGTCLLDNGQIFYQVIWNKNNTYFPKKFSDIYRMLSVPPIETYGKFGIKTDFREVNDIITTEGRKIAGLGGANIGNSMVFVGSIILDFDHDTMAKVIRVPDEKFRDKMFKNLKEYVSSMRKELGEIPPRNDVVRVLIENFQKTLGRLEPTEIKEDTLRKVKEVANILVSPEFVFRPTTKKPDRVKIKSGVELIYTSHKAKGGLIRTAQEVVEDIIRDIGITGDFTMNPKEGIETIEERVIDAKRDKGKVLERIGDAYDEGDIDAPGVSPEDFTEAIIKESPEGQ